MSDTTDTNGNTVELTRPYIDERYQLRYPFGGDLPEMIDMAIGEVMHRGKAIDRLNKLESENTALVAQVERLRAALEYVSPYCKPKYGMPEDVDDVINNALALTPDAAREQEQKRDAVIDEEIGARNLARALEKLLIKGYGANWRDALRAGEGK